MKINFKKALFITNFICLVLLLSACGHKHEMKKLNRYINSVKSSPKQNVAALPEFKSFKTYQLPDMLRRSPFSPNQATKLINKDLFETNRPRQALEFFPLDSLRMVGTLKKGPTVWALVAAPDKNIHRLKPGDYVGQNYGRVVNISNNRIDIMETIPDGNNWVKRPAEIVLYGMQHRKNPHAGSQT